MLLAVTIPWFPPDACASPAPGHQGSCVWEGVADARNLRAHLNAWLVRHAASGTVCSGISIDGNLVKFALANAGRNTETLIHLRMEGTCDDPVTIVSGDDTFPSEALDELLAGLPLTRRSIALSPPGPPSFQPPDPPTGPTAKVTLDAVWNLLRNKPGTQAEWPAMDRVAFLIAALLGAVALAAARGKHQPPRFLASLTWVLLLALGVLAILPVVVAPLSFGPEVERLVLARQDPLGDWNHPSLLYLLSHPVTRLSLAPEVVRLVPALSVLVLGFLVHRVARRMTGEPAAFLAAAWYLAGSRTRFGLTDFGDWDLAGCFLGGTLLLLTRMDDRPDAPGRARQILLVLLVLLATLSSWLALIPAAVLTVLLLFRGWRDRAWIPLAVSMLLVLGVRGLAATRVFLVGRSLNWEKIPFRDVLWEIVTQVSPGMTWVGLLLVPIGIGTAIALRRRLSGAFLSGSLVLLPFAVLAIWRLSASNGGYYINLASGLAAIAGALGLHRIATGLNLHHTTLRASMFAILATTATVDLPNARSTDGAANVPAFARLIEDDSSPVVTDRRGLSSLVHYQRAFASNSDLSFVAWVHAHAMHDVFQDDARTWVHLPAAIQAPSFRNPVTGSHFYLVLRDVAHRGGLDARLPQFAFLQSCTPLFPPRKDATFLRCPQEQLDRLRQLGEAGSRDLPRP